MVFIVPGETLKFNQGETEPVFLEITDKYWECHRVECSKKKTVCHFWEIYIEISCGTVYVYVNKF